MQNALMMTETQKLLLQKITLLDSAGQQEVLQYVGQLLKVGSPPSQPMDRTRIQQTFGRIQTHPPVTESTFPRSELYGDNER